MEVAQLNARIDARIKREGDATLARLGMSATEVIRALWTYLAEAQTVPSFMRAQEEPVEPSQASDVAQQGAGLALTMAQDLGLVHTVDTVGYEELRDLAFQELVEEGVYHV